MANNEDPLVSTDRNACIESVVRLRSRAFLAIVYPQPRNTLESQVAYLKEFLPAHPSRGNTGECGSSLSIRAYLKSDPGNSRGVQVLGKNTRPLLIVTLTFSRMGMWSFVCSHPVTFSRQV